MNERACGECCLCCKLVEVAPLNKPVNQWCQHCEIGQGCRIYPARPQECQDYACLWLQGLIPESLYPLSARIVFERLIDGTLLGRIDPGTVKVDATVQAFIADTRQRGIDVLIARGTERFHLKRTK